MMYLLFLRFVIMDGGIGGMPRCVCVAPPMRRTWLLIFLINIIYLNKALNEQ